MFELNEYLDILELLHVVGFLILLLQIMYNNVLVIKLTLFIQLM